MKTIVHWFLDFCSKQNPPLIPDRKAGNYFFTTMVHHRKPTPWQKDLWKEAIGAYLDIADPKRQNTTVPDGNHAQAAKTQLETPWETRFTHVLRCRHLAYRTEQTYLG
jgi:hypothetical protein